MLAALHTARSYITGSNPVSVPQGTDWRSGLTQSFNRCCQILSLMSCRWVSRQNRQAVNLQPLLATHVQIMHDRL